MGFKRILKNYYFRIKFFSKKVTIHSSCNIALGSDFGGCNVIGKDSMFAGRLGFGSYIGENSNVLGHIGKYCSIASDVKFLSGTHPTSDFVSTSPVFYSVLRQNNMSFVDKNYFDEILYADKVNKYVVIVGNDVWIGTGAIIVGGITIGDGAIILANATVNMNVPPYSIVGGVPAKVIKHRFDDDTISFLLKFNWWNRSTEWIRDNVYSFHNVISFKERFNN